MCKKEHLPQKAIKDSLVRLLKSDDDIKRLMVVSLQETVISTYNSHFPKAEELEKLESIRPGITEDMIAMMKDHQEHEIAYDLRVLDQEDRRLSIINSDMEKAHKQIVRGQIIGAGVVFGVFVIAWKLVEAGSVAATVSLLAAAGGLSAFMGITAINKKRDLQDDDPQDYDA
jgi:uncharacterized membrane protein